MFKTISISLLLLLPFTEIKSQELIQDSASTQWVNYHENLDYEVSVEQELKNVARFMNDHIQNSASLKIWKLYSVQTNELDFKLKNRYITLKLNPDSNSKIVSASYEHNSFHQDMPSSLINTINQNFVPEAIKETFVVDSSTDYRTYICFKNKTTYKIVLLDSGEFKAVFEFTLKQ